MTNNDMFTVILIQLCPNFCYLSINVAMEAQCYWIFRLLIRCWWMWHNNISTCHMQENIAFYLKEISDKVTILHYANMTWMTLIGYITGQKCPFRSKQTKRNKTFDNKCTPYNWRLEILVRVARDCTHRTHALAKVIDMVVSRNERFVVFQTKATSLPHL